MTAPSLPVTRRFHALETRRVAAAILVLSCLLITACRKQEAAPPAAFVPNTGQIQILNGCGKSGVAEAFRDFLTGLGFDVIEFGNARDWNYEHTLVIARMPSDRIASDMARALGTPRLLHLQHPESLVAATVIIGNDYEELMRTWPKQKAKPSSP